ncbi:helix-turn-helix transcriptional regulator [Sporosarcina saromensis]|uniref:Helix-turn-helix transcriptional regulator n=1 Tax=Sporosarcina saromensis TaxID=359365 RepID=A0ABU4G9Z6_9BACL|nr:helix-turn-helix transcriptional regulator [Sporosarcina saromensis]MDW0113811.1 helix-turn-helix transcriptional regulator [Sporosarcina saromensis]
MAYGAILKACRMRKGLTQEELADMLHMEQADVSRIENDRKEPMMTLFQRWALATDSSDVLVAFIAGVEGVTMLSTILSTVGTGVIGFIRLGGLL